MGVMGMLGQLGCSISGRSFGSFAGLITAGPAGYEAAGGARAVCKLPWMAVPYPQVGVLVMAGPSVTMYPSLRHGLLLVASKGRMGIRAVTPGLGHV